MPTLKMSLLDLSTEHSKDQPRTIDNKREKNKQPNEHVWIRATQYAQEKRT